MGARRLRGMACGDAVRTEPLTDRMTIARVLRAAAARLAGKPKCKGWLARDAKGNVCDSLSPDAHTFCVIGALNASAPSSLVTQDAVLFLKTAIDIPTGLVGWFEDPLTTVKDVCALLERAAKKAEGKKG